MCGRGGSDHLGTFDNWLSISFSVRRRLEIRVPETVKESMDKSTTGGKKMTVTTPIMATTQVIPHAVATGLIVQH